MATMKPNFAEKMVFSLLSIRIEASVPEIAEHLEIPNSTVVGILGRLKKKGLVVAASIKSTSRGRPIITYRLRLPGPVATFLFGGTQLVGAIFDENLTVKALRTIEFTKIDTLDIAVRFLKEQLTVLKSMAKLDRPLSGVAISLNAVQSDTRMFTSTVLPWASELVEKSFSAQIGLPVKYLSFMLSGLLSEYQKLSDPVPGSLVRLNVADGVSACSMIGSNVYQGNSLLAGQLGHITANPEGPLCGCGRKGCLESYCSGPAIYRRIINELKSGVVCSIDMQEFCNSSPRHGIEMVWRAWQQGDNYIRALMEEILGKIGWGLGLVISLLDPEIVSISGYVLQDKAEWLDEIRRVCSRHVFSIANRDLRFYSSTVADEDELRVIGASFYYDPLTPQATSVTNAF